MELKIYIEKHVILKLKYWYTDGVLLQNIRFTIYRLLTFIYSIIKFKATYFLVIKQRFVYIKKKYYKRRNVLGHYISISILKEYGINLLFTGLTACTSGISV